MNIQELLNEMQSFRESLEQPTKDLAATPADMEKVEVDEINPKEPEVDAKGEKSVCDIVKALEEYQAELDKIKKEDPETKFEMIDNKDPMKECEGTLISDEEKAKRAEELKKTRGKRNTKPVEEDLKPEIEEADVKEIKPETEVDHEKEVKKAIEEPKQVELKDVLDKPMDESVSPEVVAKYETVDGKHEIVRTADGLYKNRYYLKEDGKARRTTRGVKNLPTAVGAMMKRFPEATEIVDQK